VREEGKAQEVEKDGRLSGGSKKKAGAEFHTKGSEDVVGWLQTWFCENLKDNYDCCIRESLQNQRRLLHSASFLVDYAAGKGTGRSWVGTCLIAAISCAWWKQRKEGGPYVGHDAS